MRVGGSVMASAAGPGPRQWGVPLTERLTQITQALLAEPEHESTLDRVVQLAVQTIPAADECGVVLRRPGGGIDTPAATSPTILELDDLQDELRQGPCVEAIWSLDTWVINDMTTEARWPQWTSHAVRAGIGSALSVRIETHADVIGALNLYARAARAFDHTDIAVASIFARHTAYALAVVDQREQMNMALLSRQVIGAAQGMLMQRYGLNLDQSFEVLRRYSQESNIKLRDLAQHLVQHGLGDDRHGDGAPNPYAGLPGHPFHTTSP